MTKNKHSITPTCALLACIALYLNSISAAIADTNASYASAMQEAIAQLPPGSHVAAMIRDPAGNELLALNSEQLLTPASTLKVLTASAAYYQLGPQFRFQTQLRQQANGDVSIQFSGDPLLRREDLRQLLADGMANGMARKIRDLYLDGSLFRGHDWSDAQSWDNRNTCFAAPAAAISLDHNCFKASLTAGKAGNKVRVGVADATPITIRSHAVIVSRSEAKRLFCRLELRHQRRGLYELHGCVTPGQLPMTLKVAIVDSAYYTRSAIKEEAAALGIQITGDIHQLAPPQPGMLLAQHRSSPLTDYLERMLQRSDNQIADVLFKTVGSDYYSVPGNYRNGAAAVRQLLLDHAGVDLQNSYLADGSGLSPHNQVTVTNLVDLLAHIATMEDRRLYDALPVAGISGTLRHRYGFDKKPLRGNVRAKTGHLAGHYNLAGFLTNAERQTLSFSIFVSGYSLATDRKQRETNQTRHVGLFFQTLLTALQQQDNQLATVSPDRR
jgi:D-alanyl-D-alanine carboxypeptidase/D-alanyl-D-alanine-endopeptidase (penicillin-binding protein 4)